METSETQLTLDKLAVGSRLIVRSKTDWRFAAISRISEEKVTLTVCSPTGRNYRLWRSLDVAVTMEGTIPVLPYEAEDTWHNNLGRYDQRW